MRRAWLSAVLLVLAAKASPPESATPWLGFGSTLTVMSAIDQAMLYSGFEVGLKATVKEPLSSNALLAINSSERGDLAPAVVAQKLIAAGVQMVVGFPTSHEALLMGEAARKSGMLSFSASAGHQRLAEMGPLVFTISESMHGTSEFFFKMLRKRFHPRRGLLVVNPKSPFSTNQHDSLIQTLKANPFTPSLELESFPIENPRERLSEDNIQRLKRPDYDFVFATIYPEESGPLFRVLDTLTKQVPIFTSTWAVAECEVLRQLLSRYREPIYSTSAWLPRNPNSRVFERRVRHVLGKEATTGLAYAYDLGVVVGTIVNRAHGKTKEAFIEAFRANPCFDNTSAGRLCFSPQGGHSDRQMYLIQFVKEKGFVRPVPP